MKAPTLIRTAPLTLLMGAVLIICACVDQKPTESIAERQAVCNGQPEWCLIATSEMDDHRPAYVYMDGKEQGIILPDKTLRIPVTAGETHQVNFCAYFDVAERKVWKCTPPTNTKFDAGNSTLVVAPTITTLIACKGLNDVRPYC